LQQRETPQQLFIKLIALALVGGYAGGSLLESSASHWARRVEKEQVQIINQVRKDSEAIQKQKVEQDQMRNNVAELEAKNSEAIKIAGDILRGTRLQDMKKFERLIQEASPWARLVIATHAEIARELHWHTQKELLEGPRLIFQALVKNADANSNDWWYGSLGYCYKDQLYPNYAVAVEWLTKAIDSRNPERMSGAYEFNRAFCNIKLLAEKQDEAEKRASEEQISNDLDSARKFRKWNNIINHDNMDDTATVQNWLRDRDKRPH
jgi:hypothetical protein